jgi:hypothetical protein
MTQGGRPDPIEIIARVGGVNPDPGGRRRAFEVWSASATKAGWSVETIAMADNDAPGNECGVVLIEGLEYKILYGRRVRRMLLDDSTGSVVERPTFAFAAWAEPVLDSLR